MLTFMLVFIFCALIKNNSRAESDVGFPEHERPDFDRTNTRVPLYIPGRCPSNELLYPGNQETDWICDCGFGFVYYAPKDGCYAAYRRGPCPENQYLILPTQEFNPKCVDNPCKKDGHVLYEGQCYELNRPGKPCKPLLEGGGIFGVNTTTLKLGCLKGTELLSIIQVPSLCPKGSRRDRNNTCRKIFESKANNKK